MSARTSRQVPGVQPRKSLGQHFLSSPRILEKVVEAAEVGPEDVVLEVGPGLGHLTRLLDQRAERVVAVEIDERLAAMLPERLHGSPSLEIVQGDILQLSLVDLIADKVTRVVPPYKVVANIPYYITSALLRQILETRPRPRLVVLMLQQEVVQRITARPGQMSLLAVSVQFFGKPTLIAHVPAAAFHPAPKVDSAIIRIDPYDKLALDEGEIPAFFDLVRAGFSQRRKQLRNSLAHGSGVPVELLDHSLEQSEIDGRRRAQTLSLEEWVTLHQALQAQRQSRAVHATGGG
jgi:16S rRNA (adenine1518-N6/adenine1519-N6)-dimethyltransferase